MTYKQGNIVLVPFPLSNLSSSKVRPAIIISNSNINKTEDVILAAITSIIRDDEFSYKIENIHLSNPLFKPSEVRCHKLFTCDKSIIRKTISKLDNFQIEILSRLVKRSFSIL